jgi:hypothetical protein
MGVHGGFKGDEATTRGGITDLAIEQQESVHFMKAWPTHRAVVFCLSEARRRRPC